MIMRRLLQAIVLAGVLLSVRPSWALIGSGGGGGGGGSITPGTNNFFTDPNFIYPAGTGNIWFVDSASGNDGNNCKSPAAACATITHAMSLATADAGDVIVIFPGTFTYDENIVVTKEGLTFFGSGYPVDPQGVNQLVFIAPTTGVPLTVNSSYDSFYNMSFFGPPDHSPAVIVNANGNIFIRDNISGYDTSTPEAMYLNVSGGRIIDSTIEIAAIGLRLGASAFSGVLRRSWFYGNTKDIVADSGAATDSGIFDGDYFADQNKAVYIDMSAAASTTPNTFCTGCWFNVSGGLLTRAQLSGLSHIDVVGSSPSGDVDSSLTATKTVTSSAVLHTAATDIFTASGNVLVNSITIQTNATGFAGCTNLNLLTDQTNGAATLAARVVSTDLGANKTVNFATGGATTLAAPFALADTKKLQLEGTVADCTGAGTGTVTVNYTRQVPYASLTVD